MVTKNLNRLDMDRVPKDILLDVFGYLSLCALVRLQQTCKTFYAWLREENTVAARMADMVKVLER